MYKHILIATDGSEFSVRALNSGLRLARDLGAAVTVVTVTEKWSALEIAAKVRLRIEDPIEHYERVAEAAAQSVLADAADAARQMGMSINPMYLACRPPAEGIVETAQRLDCDLIAMGSHGRRGLTTLILGSVTNEVLAKSRLPVLIIR
jgi:nucleotide-binding universal stress UspA family protein